jgi:putative MATE family efflux protein
MTTKQPTAATSRLHHFFTLIKSSLRGEQHDYTQGNIKAAILLLAVPMILEMGLESVFALVDIFFVGRLGENAITTVGLTESFITIIYSIAIGLSTAATAMVARRIGEKNPAAAAKAGMQCLVLSTGVAIVLGTLGVIFAPNILQLMGAAPEVVRDGTIFTRIMMGSSLLIILLFLINGIFRGAGDAAMAMKSLWIASLINIILCPLLINGYGPFPQLGLKGAAIATAIGRSTGVLYQCYHLFFSKKNTIRFSKANFVIDWPLIRSIISLGWPSTFQFLLTSGSWIVLAWIVSTTGGTSASAGYQVAIRNVVFFILPAWGLSNAAATLVGQNLGAQQPDRAERSALLATRYNAYFMFFVTVLFVFFARPIIDVFTNDAAVLATGARALTIIGCGYVFYGIGMVMVQSLNGAGDTRTPTIISAVAFWGIQVPLAFVLSKFLGMGPTGAFIAIPVGETSIAVLAYIWFKKGKWKEKKV